MKMRIAIHCDHYGYDTGSITLNVRKYASLLTKKGHEVFVITKTWNASIKKNLQKYEKENGFEIYRVKRGNLPFLGSLFYFFRVLSILKKIKPDILHEHELCGIGYLSKKFLKLPYISYGRGIDALGGGFFRKLVIRISLKYTDKFIGLSEYMEKYANKMGFRNTTYIHNGMYLDEFKEPYKPKPHSLLYVNSDLRASKYPDNVIKAMPIITKKFPNSTLVVVGDRKDRVKLEELADDLGLSDKIKFVGHLPNKEVIKLMKKATIFF